MKERIKVMNEVSLK